MFERSHLDPCSSGARCPRASQVWPCRGGGVEAGPDDLRGRTVFCLIRHQMPSPPIAEPALVRLYGAVATAPMPSPRCTACLGFCGNRRLPGSADKQSEVRVSVESSRAAERLARHKGVGKPGITGVCRVAWADGHCRLRSAGQPTSQVLQARSSTDRTLRSPLHAIRQPSPYHP
jgi:hypothetical protein